MTAKQARINRLEAIAELHFAMARFQDDPMIHEAGLRYIDKAKKLEDEQ